MRSKLGLWTLICTLWAAPMLASAAPALRYQTDVRGSFQVIGNTLGYDCAATTPAPVVGTVGACGTAAVLGGGKLLGHRRRHRHV